MQSILLVFVLLEVEIAQSQQQNDEYVKVATSLCNAGYKQYCLTHPPEQQTYGNKESSIFTAPLMKDEPQPSPEPSPSPIVLFIPESARPPVRHFCHDEWMDPCKVCKERKDPGPCRAYFVRYYFDDKNKKCERMVYGGCGGNYNNFQNIPECNQCCAGFNLNHCP
eukprot:TRINITY_DN28334_c0_g1_i1.p3 TRINITY_DN28334_c0_g1~~TRINITY_DN28334_c0_g1_i1.p3  ORF type:complete len:166 (-),score=17.42 TRINITY_DN28334_c0_g1_i1:448-945(-)